MEKKRFELGRIVATRGVANRMEADPAFHEFCLVSLARHHNGDWGELVPEDWDANDSAIESGDERLLSAYIYRAEGKADEKIWIITEWDRSATTILYPHEY